MSQICAGEIYGYKFPVSCFPEKYLNNCYSSSWKNLEQNDLTYKNIADNKEEWSDLEWFHVNKFFFSNGTIDFIQTYNKFISESKLSSLPSLQEYIRFIKIE